MKEQHRIETPRKRSERGRKLAAKMKLTSTDVDIDDLAHLRGIEQRLTKDQLAVFRKHFNSKKCRGMGGVRPAADLALQAMESDAIEAIRGKDAKKRWRSG